MGGGLKGNRRALSIRLTPPGKGPQGSGFSALRPNRRHARSRPVKPRHFPAQCSGARSTQTRHRPRLIGPDVQRALRRPRHRRLRRRAERRTEGGRKQGRGEGESLRAHGSGSTGVDKGAKDAAGGRPQIPIGESGKARVRTLQGTLPFRRDVGGAGRDPVAASRDHGMALGPGRVRQRASG